MKLHFSDGSISDVEITKETQNYIYFTAKRNYVKYRADKYTKSIQVYPYWKIIDGLRITN